MMMPADDESGRKVLRLVPSSRKEDRADRMLALMMILVHGGGRITASLWMMAVHLLAAVGLLSLIGR